MARHDSSKSRVTPKGTRSTQPKDDGTGVPRSERAKMPESMPEPSPQWVPILMFALFLLGVLCIVLNYLSVLPGSPDNWYLLGGLGFVLAGIFTATQYR